jgi:hypothetical protein
LILLVPRTVSALERPKLTLEQIQELDRRDSELFSKIVGVWMFEAMGNNMRHVAQRTIYREDGTFVSDYRYSNAGEVSYRRATGFWYPLMGWFCEEETKSTDERLIPRMVRWVNDPIDKELRIESRTGTEAVLVRGVPPAEDFNYALDSLLEKELEASLADRNMLGYVAEETGEKDSEGRTLHRWILKSGLLKQDATKEAGPVQK